MSLLSFISYSVEKVFYGLRPWVFGLLNISPLCQRATSIQCVKYGNTYTGKSFYWHTGDDISDFDIFKCKTDCSTQNVTSLKHLISKMNFTAIKYSGQGSFMVKKGTIGKLLFY